MRARIQSNLYIYKINFQEMMKKILIDSRLQTIIVTKIIDCKIKC